MDAIYDADIVGAGVPDKLFVRILCLLPPRVLAVCRFVSRKWRATIDDNDLLLPAGYSPPCGIFTDGYFNVPMRLSQLKIGNGRHDHGGKTKKPKED